MSLCMQTAVTNLFDAISGTGKGTGLLAYMFNQAGGQVSLIWIIGSRHCMLNIAASP